MKSTMWSECCRRAVKMAALGVVAAIPTGLMAVPAIDGNVQGFAEGYTAEYDVSFNVQKYAKNPVSGGKLYTYQSGNILDVGLIAPVSIDDNTYGTSAHNADGWSDHKFSELLGSDAWDMTIKTVGGSTITINLDYLFKDANNNYYATATQGDAKNTTAGYGAAITVASSLQYDVNDTVNGGTPPANSPTGATDPQWINEIMYEWQIDFTGLDPFSVQALLDSMKNSDKTDYLHMSPNKLGGNEVYLNPPTTPPSVPDGGQTVVLCGLAMLALAGYSWHSRKRQALKPSTGFIVSWQ